MQNDLENQYLNIKNQIPIGIQLVAVSKNHSVEQIEIVYNLKQKVFGENKVQELVEKYEALPKDIEWHLIGHLQTNKVKYIAPFVHTIQSVDSKKILIEINKEALKNKRIINVLLQVKIAEEESKFGLNISEAKEIYQEYLNENFPNIKINGLMGMATFTDNKNQVKSEFLKLKKLFDELNQLGNLETLSMGMSDDFKLAIDCGANSVRIGSSIFGKRLYN
ncbi:YggS family pyridoxal phosphate-dependent enzyme [Halpernia sp.]|uniref:YggS family pyridoxal phosphate-dependent enzyme n=1 Tax=Halpernia sp. TaxID=2782209 RepID=UPI003A90F83E